ncbi:MAG: hypothetical protein ACRCW0_08060 [Clostridium sp.]
MENVDKVKKINSIFLLIINNDIVQALKVAIDTLSIDVIETMQGKNGRKSIEYKEFRENKIKFFNLLRDYLKFKKVKKFELIFKDLVALILYFDLENDHKIFIGLENRIKLIIQGILMVLQSEKDNANNIECNFTNTLLNSKDLFYANDPKCNILDYYYSLWFYVDEILGKNLWGSLSELKEYNTDFHMFSNEELQKLYKFKEDVEENQFILDKCIAEKINDVIENEIEIEDIKSKVKVLYDIRYFINQLEKFKDADDTIDKNSYGKGIKEKAFHQHIYPYLCRVMGQDNGIILSEISTGQERYDLYYYDIKRDMSILIELKVNELTNISKDIGQLEGYLNKLSYKDSIFMKEPDFGVLLIYNIGTKKLVDRCEKLKVEIACIVNNNMISCKNMAKPIVVFILGESKIKVGK